MEIERLPPIIKKVPFCQIEIGDWFDYAGTVYIKSELDRCIALSSAVTHVTTWIDSMHRLVSPMELVKIQLRFK